ncbi:MAG: HSP20 family small heat-shock protein [Polyangiaceae bacterium]
MANISVRKEAEARPAATSVWEPRWDAFRTMRELMNWDPFREMAQLVPQGGAGFVPSFEVKETKDGYSFKADVPGVKEADLDITVTGNRLTVSGKREAEKQEHTDTFYAFERSYGSFTRSFTLPEGVDTGSVHADLSEGVLTLSIKKTPEAQPKKIAIQSAAKKS